MVVKTGSTDGPYSVIACYMPGSSSFYAHFTRRKLEHREVIALAQDFPAANVRMDQRGPEAGNPKQGTDKVPSSSPPEEPTETEPEQVGSINPMNGACGL